MTTDSPVGPVQHVVLLTFSPEMTDEMISAAAVALRALPGQIPEIRDYRVGIDLALTDGNAQLSVVADFADHDDYLTYSQNADHQDVIATHIRPYLAGRTASQSLLN